jgi:hypothetical protein
MRTIVHDITERKLTEAITLAQRDLSTALSGIHELGKAFELCLETALRISRMDCGGIYLVDEASGALELKFSLGLSEQFIKAVSFYDRDSANAPIVMNGKPIYMFYPDLPVAMSDVKLREGLRSIAIIPILFENRVIACLNVASFNILRFSHAELVDAIVLRSVRCTHQSRSAAAGARFDRRLMETSPAGIVCKPRKITKQIINLRRPEKDTIHAPTLLSGISRIMAGYSRRSPAISSRDDNGTTRAGCPSCDSMARWQADALIDQRFSAV